MVSAGDFDKTAIKGAASKDPDTNIYDLQATVTNRQQSQLFTSSSQLLAKMTDTKITADYTHNDVWRDDVGVGLNATSFFTLYFTPETNALLDLTGNFIGTHEAFYADFSFGPRGNNSFTKRIGGGSLSQSFSFSDTLTAGQQYQFGFYGRLIYEGLSDKLFSQTGNYNFELSVMEITGQDTNPVPEPATMFLFGLGLLGLAGVNRKKL
ncbi:MAG: PEP-CTERM sorting domain-containing protein [Desulfobacula sp.]|nr:PEP-CTERM sorting domain-containing protein [Desulfobacula sp.]